MINILFNGVGRADIALTLNRVAVGMFFMLSGYHKLFNPQRHRALADELRELGVHAVGFNQWWVPTVEFAAGVAVVIGFLAPLAAFGLLVIIFVAIATSGRQRINIYKPIDEWDRIGDWLYLPEILYAFTLIVVISAGAGPYSLDALILGLIDKRGAWVLDGENSADLTIQDPARHTVALDRITANTPEEIESAVPGLASLPLSVRPLTVGNTRALRVEK